MAAPPSAPELAAGHRDDLDAGLAQQGVGVDVAVIGHHHAGRDAQKVVTVVPLLAFRFIGIAAGGHGADLRQAERRGNDLDEGSGFGAHVERARLLAGAQAVHADGVHHLGEDSGQVAVAEAEDGVHVHRAARLRDLRGQHMGGAAGSEQAARQLAHPLRRAALTHADEHHALAQRHHVPAFERGHAVVLVGVAPPDLGLGAELRVEAVDRCHQQRFLPARRPEHRAQHHAFADPATVVASEQRVGQRRQQQVGRRAIAAQQPGGLERQFGARHAADQVLGQLGRRQVGQPGAQFRSGLGIDEVGAELALEQPLPRRRNGHRVGEQVVHFQHLHIALLQRGAEGVVIVAGLADPEHVVEQQIVAIGGRQALLRQAGTTDHHLAQAADFGMQTLGHGIAFRVCYGLRVAANNGTAAAGRRFTGSAGPPTAGRPMQPRPAAARPGSPARGP